jgi:uncharacterized membrane protein
MKQLSELLHWLTPFIMAYVVIEAIIFIAALTFIVSVFVFTAKSFIKARKRMK